VNTIEKLCSNGDAPHATEEIAPAPAQQPQSGQQAAAQQGTPQSAVQRPQPGQQAVVQPGVPQPQAAQQQLPQPRAVTPDDWWELLQASSSDTLDQHPKRRLVTWLLFRTYAAATAFAPQVDLDMWRCAAVAAAVQTLCCGPAPALEAAIGKLAADRVREDAAGLQELGHRPAPAVGAAIATLAPDRVREVAAALQKLGHRPAPAVEAAIAALVPYRLRDYGFKASVSKARQKAARHKLPKGITLEFLASREDIAAALKKLLEKLPLLQLSNR
jgi:hypothetical protein